MRYRDPSRGLHAIHRPCVDRYLVAGHPYAQSVADCVRVMSGGYGIEIKVIKIDAKLRASDLLGDAGPSVANKALGAGEPEMYMYMDMELGRTVVNVSAICNVIDANRSVAEMRIPPLARRSSKSNCEDC